MCGRLPFSTEYNSEVPGPQGADSPPSLLWDLHILHFWQILLHFILNLPPHFRKFTFLEILLHFTLLQFYIFWEILLQFSP